MSSSDLLFKDKWMPLRIFVRLAAKVAGIGILFMMTVTCIDIILRKCGSSLPGAYDLVRIAGGITIAAALPLTTAVKGHVAIEYFFHRMGHGGRIIVDSVMRSVQTLAFLFAAYSFYKSGWRLLRSGEVMPTLQCHIFWLAWLIAVSCLLTAFVTLFHLLRPGVDFMRPFRLKFKVQSSEFRVQNPSVPMPGCPDAQMPQRPDAPTAKEAKI